MKILIFGGTGCVVASIGALLLCGAAAKIPERIASGTVASDEIVIELLERANQLQRLVAVSVFAQDPRYSSIKTVPPQVKGRVGGELESLVALRPDLVILAHYNRPEMIAQLRNAGIPTMIQARFDSIADIQQNILSIGTATGTPMQATALVAWMQSAGHVRPLPRAPSVISFSMTGTLVGADTLLDDCIARAGGTNLARTLGVTGWQKVQAEALAPLDPDFILAGGEETDSKRIAALIAGTPGYQQMARRNRYRLILIPEPVLLAVSHHAVGIITHLSAAFSLHGANLSK